ncbi:hypothetical protein EKK58_08620 [Candidatus Dependentiae bacterium]|nr:MAG: hypothetical protein EKK58_08620 [Candidatus Dependentiae bacterium]
MTNTDKTLTERQAEFREVESTKRSLRQCSTGQEDLNRAISWYLKVGFEDGFDAFKDSPEYKTKNKKGPAFAADPQT